MMRIKQPSGKIALGILAAALCCLAIACIPPPPGANLVVTAGGPLPPPPPFVLPPSVSVSYNSRIGYDYVSGVNYDAFYVGGYFYTRHRDHWYCATRPGAAWVVVEPRYVPRVLAAGPPPPGWRQAASRPPRPVTTFRNALPFPVPSSASVSAPARSGTSRPRTSSPSSRSARPYAPGQVKPPGSARPYAPGQLKKPTQSTRPRSNNAPPGRGKKPRPGRR